MPSHIEIKDLNVFYGNTQILKNINLIIPDKSITVIIGPSGCGKSTLLKCFNRLIDLEEDVRVTGTVKVDGEDIYNKNADITEIRRKMGLLMQKPFPLPLSIYGNVAYGPRIHGVRNRRVLNDIVVKNLKIVGLWDEVKNRIHSPATRLSLGQQQRLCMARGLAVEPEIILGDEPMASLDPVNTCFIENQLLLFKEDYSIIIVTHSLAQARKLADYVGFIYMGELIEFGTAEEVFKRPQQELTREYLSGGIS